MITVVGSLNYDLVTYTDTVPAAGETTQANAFEKHLGGKGLNEALACARLLPRSQRLVRMIGHVGSDAFGRELRSALVELGVDTEHVSTIEGQSLGVAVILVEASGENRILITAGANGDLKPSERELEQYFADDAGYVVLQNEFPRPLETISWIKRHRPSINIAYNPSPFKPELVTAEALSQVDLLIVNEGEARGVARLVGEDNQEFEPLAAELVKHLNPHNVCTVIITLGARGCVYAQGREVASVASVKVDKVVDTTGAGDTFFGGVVLQLSLGRDIGAAVWFATVASSIAIGVKGAAESIPTLAQVQLMNI